MSVILAAQIWLGQRPDESGASTIKRRAKGNPAESPQSAASRATTAAPEGDRPRMSAQEMENAAGVTVVRERRLRRAGVRGHSGPTGEIVRSAAGPQASQAVPPRLPSEDRRGRDASVTDLRPPGCSARTSPASPASPSSSAVSGSASRRRPTRSRSCRKLFLWRLLRMAAISNA